MPLESSLLDALVRDPPRVAVLQRQDGLGPRLTVAEPAAATEPTTGEIERLLAEVPIFRMLSPADIHALALGARPLLLGPTQRFVIEGREGTSLFLVGEGEVEVRLRRSDGTDWLVETMGRGEVVGRWRSSPVSGAPRPSGPWTRPSCSRSAGSSTSRCCSPIPSGWRSWPTSWRSGSPGRRVRVAAVDGASSQHLLARMTRSFFGGPDPRSS